ncbi:unnamed protein product [Brachionus calyciflorus]|uniref:Uncharacterized protein n=1 Tax=Brachionus calyciflorus TaxID=104777 RepID=A0A814D150_9BILA|nr:unnamed protein product [Brachionus calyciflorus]
MSLLLDLTNTARLIVSSSSSSNQAQQMTQTSNTLILQAPQPNDILFFNENGFLNSNQSIKQKKSNLKSLNYSIKKQVKFPEGDGIIKDYSEAPKRGWIPGKYPTSDLLESYLKSCDRHKTKPLNRLIPQLKALQDIDCTNGEKVNVLNLKNERLDTKQMEALEEVFKRLSFKTIDLESSQFEDDTTGATLFEILDYYDTCEKLILANVKGFGLFGWQELSKYIRKTVSLETIELKNQLFTELIYFTYLARSFRLTQSLKILHLENSNINGRLLIMLTAALKDNDQIKELYLCDNKIQPQDGQSIATIIKENKCLELLDLKNNNLQDSGLATICMGLSERSNVNSSKNGLKSLSLANNSITTTGCPYLCKALIHNCTLINLNISNNSLNNEAIYELKEALIVNKNIECLILNKVRITDEGVIALAEYIAETYSLRRLDLRGNDIRLGGLMALASSIKFNKTLDRIDLDREPKKENSIKDSIETSKRLIQDINECCLSNRREREKNELIQKELERQRAEEEDEYVKLQDLSELPKEPLNENKNIKINSPNTEEDIDIIGKDDELLKKILNRTFHTNSPNLHSPIHPNEDIINLFHLNDSKKNENLVEENGLRNEFEEDFQFIEQDLTLNPADFDKIICKSTPICINSINDGKTHVTCKKKLVFNDYESDVNNLLNELINKVEKIIEQERLLDCSSDSIVEINKISLDINCIPTPESTPVLKTSQIEPLFTSKLTNSQLSEEISNEIGL